jgi:hypothetical protein
MDSGSLRACALHTLPFDPLSFTINCQLLTINYQLTLDMVRHNPLYYAQPNSCLVNVSPVVDHTIHKFLARCRATRRCRQGAA